MKSNKFGPAFLVTAAFVGPGTVVTTTLAGANYGYALVWAILFSVLATIILQNMTARLGIVTQQGLAENLLAVSPNRLIKRAIQLLVFSAIVIGNSAYQGGNIAGASLGIEGLLGPLGDGVSLWPWLIGAIAFMLLISGKYSVVERALVVIVVIMALAFVSTAWLVGINWLALIDGFTQWHVPTGSVLTVVALIGTTIVPYNLFLHTSAVAKKWHSKADISAANRDIAVSIPIGGLLSIAIVSTAASAFFGHQIAIQSAADIAPALEPVFGEAANYLLSIGLFAAGISSAVTAPLAAAYALSGLFDRPLQMHDTKFKAIWSTILFLGVLPASLAIKPISIIFFAQIANGLLLPLVVGFLLWTMNSAKLNSTTLGDQRNTIVHNVLGIAVFVVTLVLSSRLIWA